MGMQQRERGKISMENKSMLIYSQEIKYWFDLPRKPLLIMLKSSVRGYQNASIRLLPEGHKSYKQSHIQGTALLAHCWDCSLVWLPNYLITGKLSCQ